MTDFGLAKRLEKDTGLTLSGQVPGSPNSMPPEQASAHRGLVGKRSDVNSLGAIQEEKLEGALALLRAQEPAADQADFRESTWRSTPRTATGWPQ